MSDEILLPEFIYQDKIGEIVLKGSILKVKDQEIMISNTNTINIYDTLSRDFKTSITDNKLKKVTSFCKIDGSDSLYCLGYDNGMLQIFNQKNEIISKLRPHGKRVTEILYNDNFIFSSSMDGSLIMYDIFSEEIKIWYKGCNAGIYSFVLYEDMIFCNCSDNIVRIWKSNSEDLFKVLAFTDEIINFVIFDEFVLALFVNGNLEIISFKNEIRKILGNYKKSVKINIKEDVLFLLTNDKIYSYRLLKTKDGFLTLQNIDAVAIEKGFFDFDIIDRKNIVLISKSNYFVNLNIEKKESKSNLYHKSQIIDIYIVKKLIITVSEEKAIIWELIDDIIHKKLSISFEFPVLCSSILEENFLVVGGEKKTTFYDLVNGDLVFESANKSKTISTNSNLLVTGYDNQLNFYKFIKTKQSEISVIKGNEQDLVKKSPVFLLKKIDTVKLNENITTIKISDDGKFLAVGILDNNNVYIYDIKTQDLRIKLFGHSLPVTDITFSPDSKLILTSSAEKLVKLWGTDFGECRKTFVGNSKNTQFVNNNSFLITDSTTKQSYIKYFKKHDLVKKYKGFSFGKICVGKNFMVCATKYGFKYYRIGEYALEIENNLMDSDEIEEEIMKENRIGNVGQYEQFINEIEKIEEDSNIDYKNKYQGLTRILKILDLSEIDKFVYSLNSVQVKIVVECALAHLSNNSIILSRILISVFKQHAYVFKNDVKLYDRFLEIKQKIKELRDEIGTNLELLNFN